ncbi:replication protein A 14 kDa subunit [Drosophila gunungcola]|uniref:Replication protein A 14 kDa subunit n=1 Tax=Drosophila gunungcola TaxID=103775 RepID=A0A9P9YCG0_9MUSC|nr:replication protein A 14 kDa subunit [Drosophila gunungcola]KAI8034464.1 hypothetical protein M5D96_012738 [Drosophila gunungcola]
MMDAFDPRSIINGGMLKQFNGQTVSIMVRVESVAGSTLLASSTDNQKLKINLPGELGAADGAWVEVIGVPHGADTIRAKEVIEFGGENIDFDKDGYNGLSHLINNVKAFYRSG